LYGSEGAEVLAVTYGRTFSFACKARNALQSEGINISVLKLDRIKPIDDTCYDIAAKSGKVLFFEEGMISGGIGEHFGINLFEKGFCGKYRVFGIDDEFVPQAKVSEQLKMYKLDTDGIAETVRAECGK
jgi:1-deoxy-D-xylulose-5-phosphate synthase